MPVKIWDNNNSRWLDPLGIYFDSNGEVSKIVACEPGSRNVWIEVEGRDLLNYAIFGMCEYNAHLLYNHHS